MLSSAQLGRGTSPATPLTAELRLSPSVTSKETTKQRKIRKRLAGDETALLKVEETDPAWLWLSSSEAA